MKFELTFACLLLLTTTVAQQGAETPNGSIYGVAIASDGQIAKRVGLTAVPLAVGLGARLPHTTTDDRGDYRFVNLPWWGRYTVYGEDEDAGYSSFSTGGYGQTQPPEIEITPARREAELRVNLPPKAAFLRVHLTNGRTGAPISGMSITVMRDTNPPSLAFSMSCFSTKTVLLPPDQNLFIHITSDGFREWKESVGKGKLVHLTSDSQVTFDVELDPVDLSVEQELVPLHHVSQSGATVAELNRGGWKLYRLASRLEPLREGTGELQAVSEGVVVIRDGDLLRTETLEGKPVASFSLRPASKCYSSVALVGDSLYVSDCKGTRIVDFSGREQLRVRPPRGWSQRPTSSDNGKRLLFHHLDRKVSAVRSAGEDVLAIATLGLGVADEQDNREEIRVVDTTNGNSCFDWKRGGDLSENAASSISPSGEFVAIGSAGSLSVYRLPAVCETKTTK